MSLFKKYLPWLILLIIISLVPIVIYLFIFGNVPSLTAPEAREILNQVPDQYKLIDTRSTEKYNKFHVSGSVHWQNEDIIKLKSSLEIPDSLKNKKLLVICQSGISSAFVVKKLNSLNPGFAFNVKGGMQEWISFTEKFCPIKFQGYSNSYNQQIKADFKSSNPFEQFILVFSSFFLKPFYMLLSLFLAIYLRKLKSTGWQTLKYAFVLFFAGESFCAINYLFFTESSYIFEYLHSLGMVLSFIFITYALFRFSDNRMIRFSDKSKKCVLLEQCQACYKYSDYRCSIARIFRLFILVMIIISFIPLLSEIRPVSYNTEIYGREINLSHPVIYQLFEIRFAPVIALIFNGISFIILSVSHEKGFESSKKFFAIATGFIGFGTFRLLLLDIYENKMIWFNCWEEITEFILIVGFAYLFWVFRHKIQSEIKLNQKNLKEASV